MDTQDIEGFVARWVDRMQKASDAARVDGYIDGIALGIRIGYDARENEKNMPTVSETIRDQWEARKIAGEQPKVGT